MCRHINVYTHTRAHAYFIQFLLQSCSLVHGRTSKGLMEKVAVREQWSTGFLMYFGCFHMILMPSLFMRWFKFLNSVIIPCRQMCTKVRTHYFFTVFLQVIWDSVLIQVIKSDRLVMLPFVQLNPWMLFLDWEFIETTWKYWFMLLSKFWVPNFLSLSNSIWVTKRPWTNEWVHLASVVCMWHCLLCTTDPCEVLPPAFW